MDALGGLGGGSGAPGGGRGEAGEAGAGRPGRRALGRGLRARVPAGFTKKRPFPGRPGAAPDFPGPGRLTPKRPSIYLSWRRKAGPLRDENLSRKFVPINTWVPGSCLQRRGPGASPGRFPGRSLFVGGWGRGIRVGRGRSGPAGPGERGDPGLRRERGRRRGPLGHQLWAISGRGRRNGGAGSPR